MKKVVLCAAIAIAMSQYACNDGGGRYVDLSTGKPVELVKDSASGLMVDAETRKPVTLYVDTKSNDTIYGKTGVVVNGKVRRNNDGLYVYDDEAEIRYKKDNDTHSARGDEYKIKRGDYKKEVEKDGDITIKDGDRKIKIDGETGKRKVKNDD